MAVNFVNAQGTVVKLVYPYDGSWGDCSDARVGFSGEQPLECPQSVGELAESRSVTEYTCISSNESVKSLGSVQRGSLDLEVLLDPDSLEQDKLTGSFYDAGSITVGIFLSDGTLYWFEGYVSGIVSTIPQGESLLFISTIEISSQIHECSTALPSCADSIGTETGTAWVLSNTLANSCTLCKA